MVFFIKAAAAIFGGAVSVGSIVFVILIFTVLDKTQSTSWMNQAQLREYNMQNHYYWADGDFILSLWVSIAAVVLVLLLGIAAWFVLPKEEFKKEVNYLWNDSSVRFVGLTFFFTCLMGAIFIFAELSFATAEFPPHWDEFPMYLIGSLVISAVLAGVIQLIIGLVKKSLGAKKES